MPNTTELMDTVDSQVVPPLLSPDTSSGSHRSVLSRIINAKPCVRNIEWLSNADGSITGRILFSIGVEDAGFTMADVQKRYNRQIFSNFVADFMGQLILRDNISRFTNEMMAMQADVFTQAVGSCTHQRFGMSLDIEKHELIFSFHVSLLTEILTEEFKHEFPSGKTHKRD